jgi:hypothetical protein
MQLAIFQQVRKTHISLGIGNSFFLQQIGRLT